MLAPVSQSCAQAHSLFSALKHCHWLCSPEYELDSSTDVSCTGKGSGLRKPQRKGGKGGRREDYAGKKTVREEEEGWKTGRLSHVNLREKNKVQVKCMT